MILTIPNLISAIRISLVPVFLWLLLGREDYVAAGLLIGGVGATDWIDGYLARRLGQVSELGKMLDPVADRLAVAAAVIGGWISGTVPVWFAAPLLVRETSASTVPGGAHREEDRVRTPARRPPGSISSALSSMPVALMSSSAGSPSSGSGLILYWVVAFQYLADIRPERIRERLSCSVDQERRRDGSR
jgi:phosphatidylglycerophosphate synthase